MDGFEAWIYNEFTWLAAIIFCIVLYIKSKKQSNELVNLHSAHRKDLDLLNGKISAYKKQISSLQKQVECEINGRKRDKIKYDIQVTELQKNHMNIEKSIQSQYDNLPPKKLHYIASLMSDYLTISIYEKERALGCSKKYHERQRAAKVKEIREEAKGIISELKEAQYQLDYLLQMFPELNDVINYSTAEVPTLEEIMSAQAPYNDDPISGFISRTEWDGLSSTERNQLALDRYLNRKKSNWEIGRDYELYVAHCYEKKGYTVDTFGSYMRVQDLGRDLIAVKDDVVLVIQCKCWSANKEIHENSICQLYGTVICYCIENNRKADEVEPVFVTTTSLSKKAREFANMLNITVVENFPLQEFPRIKCNIGHDEFGKTYIYHLPMDAQYDNVKICKDGECYCLTVQEAEEKGFRRAYKWHGNNDE